MTGARPVLDRSRAAVLDGATRLLLESPDLSLGELASRLGIGRTTLHRMFPTRQDLLTALAHDAIDHLEEVYTVVGLADADDVLAAVGRLVERLVPLGPRLMFLLRAAELRDDPDLDRREEALDRPLRDALGRAAGRGELDPALPPQWVLETLFGQVWVAWELVEKGVLAAADAAPLVLRTWLRGVAAPA